MERFKNVMLIVSYMDTELSINKHGRLYVRKGIREHIRERNRLNLSQGLVRGSYSQGKFSLYYQETKFFIGNVSPNKKNFLGLHDLVYLATGLIENDGLIFKFEDSDSVFIFSSTDAAILLCQKDNPELFAYFRPARIGTRNRMKLSELEQTIAVSEGKTLAVYDHKIPYVTFKKMA